MKLTLLFLIFIILICFPFVFSMVNLAKQADEEMDKMHLENMRKLKMKKGGENDDK